MSESTSWVYRFKDIENMEVSINLSNVDMLTYSDGEITINFRTTHVHESVTFKVLPVVAENIQNHFMKLNYRD